MTDVRLTATNPEDSSVVPVACNAKGELKLEEPLAFDGNLNGDLSVTGTASFAGDVDLGAAASDARLAISASYNQLGLYIAASGTGYSPIAEFCNSSGDLKANINADGSASFKGALNVTADGRQLDESPLVINNTNVEGYSIYSKSNGTGTFAVSADGTAEFKGQLTTRLGVDIQSEGNPLNRINLTASTGEIATSSSSKDDTEMFRIQGGRGSANQENVVVMTSSGSANFAGGKAGFTAEGHLWCTTVRGDTVILDATSGGMGSWQDYTPPTRREIIEQKIQNIKDAAIKPSQQLPEE